MKNLLLLIVCFSWWCCHTPKQAAKDDIKDVSQIIASEDKPLQAGDVHEITVKGRVTGDLFIFGRGVYRLADMKQPSLTLMVIPKSGGIHIKGDTVTIQVTREEILRMNGSSWSVYSEL